MAGKVEWLASGLPMEGKRAGGPRVGDRVRRDVPTCRLTDRLGDVARQIRASGWDCGVVVNEEHVVLGFLRNEVLDGASEASVEEVMEPGPSTFRPDILPEELGTYMQKRNIDSALVTTADGKLVGILQQ